MPTTPRSLSCVDNTRSPPIPFHSSHSHELHHSLLAAGVLTFRELQEVTEALNACLARNRSTKLDQALLVASVVRGGNGACFMWGGGVLHAGEREFHAGERGGVRGCVGLYEVHVSRNVVCCRQLLTFAVASLCLDGGD